MKIVQVYASKGWGGGEQYVSDLSVSLVSNGDEVVSISKKCPILGSKIPYVNSYYQLPMKGVIDVYSGILLARIINREKPDIIHIHNFRDAFVAVYAKIISGKDVKIILSRHLVKRSKNNLLYNWLYKKLDKLIFVSELAKKEFLLSGVCVDKTKIVVLHNSVKMRDAIMEGNIRDKYNITKSSVIIAFSGRVVPEKGLDVLLEALSLLRDFDFKLLVLGSGEEKYIENLKSKAAEFMIGDKVIITGFVDDVKSIISQVDIGVIPSVVRESFGLSVIEFMSLGKAVITTNNGAQPEFIEDGVNGYLVPPSDSKAIADKLKILLENEFVRLKLGECAASYFFAKLSYDRFFENIYALYKTVS